MFEVFSAYIRTLTLYPNPTGVASRLQDVSRLVQKTCSATGTIKTTPCVWPRVNSRRWQHLPPGKGCVWQTTWSVVQAAIPTRNPRTNGCCRGFLFCLLRLVLGRGVSPSSGLEVLSYSCERAAACTSDLLHVGPASWGIRTVIFQVPCGPQPEHPHAVTWTCAWLQEPQCAFIMRSGCV